MATKTVAVGVRMEPKLKELGERVAEARGMKLASYMRFLLKRELAKLSFLSADDRKAFGMLEDLETDRR